MKKFTVLLMVFVLSLMMFSVSMASGVNEVPKQVTMMVDKVYYMKGSGYYIAHTTKDEDGHFWVLQVTDIALHKEDKAFTEALRKQYQGKQVVVTYTEPVNEDEEVEIRTVKLK